MQENEVKNVENEEKKSKLAGVGKYFKGLGYDFIQSFKYNNMKLAGLLIAVPGAIFGFFLTFHTTVVGDISTIATDGTSYMADISGFALFLMMLLGILNIFTGFSVMNKKNLGTVILATVTSALMVAAGVIYFVIVFRWMAGVNAYYNNLDNAMTAIRNAGYSGTDEQLLSYTRPFLIRTEGTDLIEPLTNKDWFVYSIPAGKRISEYFNVDYVMSLGSVGLCIVSAVVGVIFAFKNYDRNYEKVDR